MKLLPPRITEPNSFILKSSAKVLFLALNLFAAYLTIKGHNAPGGGFIGGLVSALSLVLVSMVLGVEESLALLRVDPLRLTLVGLLMAYGSSLGPALFGKAFLEHQAFHGRIPGFGEIHLLTAQIFDFGVYFVVVGVTAKIMLVFSLSVQLKEPFPGADREAYAAADEEPIEEAAWGSLAPGSQDGTVDKADEPKPLKLSGKLGRRYRRPR